jgi:hypothetical protein
MGEAVKASLTMATRAWWQRAKREWECPATGPKREWECPATGPKREWECPATGPKREWECPATGPRREWECPATGPRRERERQGNARRPRKRRVRRAECSHAGGGPVPDRGTRTAQCAAVLRTYAWEEAAVRRAKLEVPVLRDDLRANKHVDKQTNEQTNKSKKSKATQPQITTAANTLQA